MAFLDNAGLARLWERITALVSNKVEKIPGKSLIEDSEITRLASVKTGLEINLTEEELEEGVYIVNADQLGGINAEEYVTKEDLVGIDGKVSSVNGMVGDVEITAETLGAITSIGGLVPDENGNIDLKTEDIGGLTVKLEGALEGESAKVNADLLGGKDASEYALKTGIVTSVNGQTGDVVVTEGGGYIDTSSFYSVSNPPPYPVSSVNGRTGAVTIDAASIGALTSAPVTSVNGKIGNVNITAAELGALTSAPVTSVNGMTGDVNVTAPVTSVNGKTGVISLTASDVGAMANTYTAPVTSVNGKTGAVTLKASDVGALANTYTPPVTSVNGKTGAVSIPEIKYADVQFTFNGESLACIGNLPSGLTDKGRIINIFSTTHSVIITAAEIVNGKLWVYARNPGSVTVDEWYGNYIEYYTDPFTARVFYF